MLVRWHRSILALSALALCSCGPKGEAQEEPAPRGSTPSASTLATSASTAPGAAGSSANPAPGAASGAPGASAAGSGASTATPAALAPGAPGPAVLSVRGGGLFQIHEGKLTRLSEEDLGDLTSGPDGVVYTHRGKVLRAGALETLPMGMYATFATAKDGTLWSLDLERTVSRLVVAGKDRKWEKEALPAGTDTLMHIAVGADGQPVVASGDKVYSKKGGQWEATPASKLFPSPPEGGPILHVDGLVRYRDVVQVLTNRGAVGLDGSKLELPEHLCPGLLFEHIAQVSPAGDLSIRCTGAVVIVDRSGKGSKLLSGAVLPKAEEVTAVAVDGQGRRWIGTDAGLAIVAPDGKPLQVWEVGSLPGEVESIAVVGAGPTLPASPDPAVKGNVKGRLLRGDRPLKGVEVEICGHPRFLSHGNTPCEGQAARVTAKTDDKGVFKLVGAPRGNYGLTLKDGKDWAILSAMGAPSCCTTLTSGGELDLGEIRLEDKEPK